jgi:hypothetical protein
LQHDQRHVTYFFDGDGELILNARLPPEVGAVVRKALETAVEAMREPKRSAANDVSNGMDSSSPTKRHRVPDW